jgi:phosphohistidine phosphatase SixA
MRRLALATALLIPMSICSPSEATELAGQAMLQALKEGGYVIYLRHDRTDLSHSDTDPLNLNDCKTQRPLSDAGRDHARKIGVAFREIHVPVDKVFSSPVCRAAETAMLAFPDRKATTPHALVYTLALPKEELGPAADELRKLLEMPPRAGTNTVLVGHTTNLKEAAGVWPKQEGGALIFRPDGHGAFSLAGSIDPADFERAAN